MIEPVWDDAPPTPGPEIMAEMAALGAAMLGSDQMPDAADLLAPGDFNDPFRGVAWEICISLDRDRQPINPQSVAERMSPHDLRGVGGPVGLIRMIAPEVAPLPGQLLAHAARVRDLATRRRLRLATQRILTSLDEREDVTQTVEDARQAIDEAAAGIIAANTGVTIGESMAETIDWMECKPEGARTPWPDVDQITNGLLAGQMITVAGRPGHGKSLVAKDVALQTALDGKPVHIATLEMDRKDYNIRIVAGLEQISLSNIINRTMTEDEWGRAARAFTRVSDLPLVMDDRHGQTMASIRAGARSTMRRFGDLGLIVIDYAQLVTPADRRLPREQQVADISRQTKMLAKEFSCPVMLLAQLNRGNQNRTDRTPVVSDIRESGAIEQDSDQVWLLHRPDQYDDERLGEVDLIIAKNRSGPNQVTIPLAFRGHCGHIASLAR